MKAEDFLEVIGAEFYTGVPDSQLKALCDCLMDRYGVDSRRHIIAANEGNCAAIAAGYHLATGKVPVVYLQNSGEGNIINPVASLLNDRVYAIPAVFVIGWRGEPGVHDEPQHIYQGAVTTDLLDVMDVRWFVITPDTTKAALCDTMEDFRGLLAKGKQVAFVVKKGALSFAGKVTYSNPFSMSREAVIEHILAVSGEDPVVSTTGKASRELFELRERAGQGHGLDFLTVGSMGHTSSIALGAALHTPDKRIWCIDGDGSALMHLGAMAVIGANAPKNLIHIVINNGAHETVGGLPTAALSVNLPEIAKACGYQTVFSAESFAELDEALALVRRAGALSFLEVKASLGARGDLGRPTTTPIQNKQDFEAHLRG